MAQWDTLLLDSINADWKRAIDIQRMAQLFRMTTVALSFQPSGNSTTHSSNGTRSPRILKL